MTKLLNKLYTQQEFKVTGGANNNATMFNSKFLASSNIASSAPMSPMSPAPKPAVNAHPVSLEGMAPSVLK